MNYQPSINYADTLSPNVPYKSFVNQRTTTQRLVGGHVEFSIADDTYEHFFTSPDELKELAFYIRIGKPLTGLRRFIAKKYAFAHQLKETINDEHIIIWNYEFDFS